MTAKEIVEIINAVGFNIAAICCLIIGVHHLCCWLRDR
jgi:hypothetical protein